MARVPVRFRIESGTTTKKVPVRFTVEQATGGAPPTPTGLGGTTKTGQVTWFWSAVQIPDLLGYELQTRYAGGAWVTAFSGDLTTFTETQLIDGQDRQARIRSVNDGGQTSLWSAAISRRVGTTTTDGGNRPDVTGPQNPGVAPHKIFVTPSTTGGGGGGGGGGGTTDPDIEIPIQPGSVSGQQFGVPYTLIGPDGTRVVFNDPFDPDYVGMITDITGLDSPEVRESADDLNQEDGGVHGDFHYGRRPITITGKILPRSSEHRNYCLTRLARATDAMKRDAQLIWTPDGGIPQTVSVRRQVPNRTPGGWIKDFHLGLVAADHRIYSLTYNQIQVGTAPWTVNPQNRGSKSTPPVITIYGPVTNPRIQNFTTGEIIVLNITLTAGNFLVIDTRAKTVVMNNSESWYRAVDFLATKWWELRPGLNDVRLSAATISQGASMTLQWRDAWI